MTEEKPLGGLTDTQKIIGAIVLAYTGLTSTGSLVTSFSNQDQSTAIETLVKSTAQTVDENSKADQEFREAIKDELRDVKIGMSEQAHASRSIAESVQGQAASIQIIRETQQIIRDTQKEFQLRITSLESSKD